MGWQSAKEPIDYDSLPECAAVYVFILNGRAFYVGSTTNLRTRIRSHLRPFFELRRTFSPPPLGPAVELRQCEQIKFKASRRYGDWLMIEARLIHRLQPPGNTTGIRPRSVD